MNEIPIRNINDMTGPTYTNDSLLTSILEAKNDNLYKRLKQLYPCVEDVKKLPQSWSTEARAQSLGLTYDNLGCYYRTTTVAHDHDEKLAAAAVTDNHIPRSCLLYYYEITVVSKGREGSMGIGLACIKNFSETIGLTKLPGWSQQTYGYHADDGCIFDGDGRGKSYGEAFGTGAVVGCGLNFVERKCFFTLNGTKIGTAFSNLPINYHFYPKIGLRTQGEEIMANFGQENFLYNIENDLAMLKMKMTNTISKYPISNFTDWQNTLHKLVQSWLIQNSYTNTAEAFSKSTKLDFKENRNRLKERQKIQDLILSGHIGDAISLIPQLCPNLLQDNPNLLFALRCRQFIELISGSEKWNYYSPESFSDFAHHDIAESTNGTCSDSKMILQQDSIPSTNTPTQSSGIESGAQITNDSVISMEDNSINGSVTGGDMNCSANGSTHTSGVDGGLSNTNNNNIMNNNNHNNNSNKTNTTTNNNENDNNCGPQNDLILKLEPLDEDAKLERLLQFGQDLNNYHQRMEKVYGKNEINEKLLHETLSLIAFSEPNQTSLTKLLDPSERQHISQLVNNTIAEAESGGIHRLPMDEVMNHIKRIIKLNDSHGKWLLDKLY